MVRVGGCTIGRAALSPGWRWSADVKPLAGTSSCELAHTAYVISGRMRVRMNDGTEAELGAGDAHYVSPGHDAWVIGEQPCVVIDFTAPAQLASAADGGSRVTCHPCGVEFRIGPGDQLDHLIAAVQQHASQSHGHDVTREHILSELQP
jgi:Cupin domain